MSSPFISTSEASDGQQYKLSTAQVWETDTGRMLIAEPSGDQYPVSRFETDEFTFTETSGAGVYTVTQVVPAGYTVLDILVGSTVVWNNSGTVQLSAGDADSATGYINAKNLKSGGDVPADTTGAVTARASGLGGTYALGKYYAAEGLITITVTTSSTGGGAGRTRVGVLMTPGAKTVVAATKV